MRTLANGSINNLLGLIVVTIVIVVSWMMIRASPSKYVANASSVYVELLIVTIVVYVRKTYMKSVLILMITTVMVTLQFIVSSVSIIKRCNSLE